MKTLQGKRIALVVDHPQRDLAGLMLTAYELCQRGAICFLVPLNEQHREIWALKPDVVLLNYARASNLSLATRLVDANIGMGVLDTEGGVWETFDSYTDLLWKDDRLRKSVVVLCAWGSKMAEHLVSHGYFTRSQITITGCPRFDFYHDTWQRVLRQDDRGRGGISSPPEQKIILINTNFSTANPRFTTREQSIAYCHKVYGWDYEEIGRVIDTEETAINATIELCSQLSVDFAEHRVVVRPHPHEDPRRYAEALAEFKNASVNTDGSVQSQIFRSALVIQRSCTTAIEAGMASIPTLSPQWIPAPYLMQNAEDASVPSYSYEELRTQVEAIIKGRYEQPRELRDRINEILEEWFYRIDGLAHVRVADAVQGASRESRQADTSRCRAFLYDVEGAENLWDFCGRWARRTLHLSPNWSFAKMRRVANSDWIQTSKYLDPRIAHEILDRIQSVAVETHATYHAVACEPSLVRGDFHFGYMGHSLTVYPCA